MSQIMSSLITEYGYTLIRFSEQKHDLWLANKENKHFPLIRLNPDATSSIMLEIEYLEQVRQFLNTFQENHNEVLIINTNMESEPFHETGFLQELANTKHISARILEAFPKLKEAIHETDNVQKEMKKINLDLQRYQQKKVQEQQRLMNRVPLFTGILVGICVVIFAASYLLGEYLGNQETSLIMLGAYYKPFIVAGNEFWRFLTSGLLHANVMHLLVNMVSLISLGQLMERVFTKWQYLLILFGSVIIGSVVTYIMTSATLSVGISGGLYGLMGAVIVCAYENGSMKVPRIRQSVFRVISINLLISLMPNINMAAHIGGFFTGAIIGFLFVKTKRWQVYKKHVMICFAIICIGLGYFTMKVNTPGELYPKTDADVANGYKKLGLKGYANRLEGYFEYLYFSD